MCTKRCLGVCIAQQCALACGGQRRALVLLDLLLQIMVSLLVLGIDSGSSARAMKALIHHSRRPTYMF